MGVEHNPAASTLSLKMRVLILLCVLVAVVSAQRNNRRQNCQANPCSTKCDPCNKQCPQRTDNDLLVQLDNLSPDQIVGIFNRDSDVRFYLGCVLETGSCDGIGQDFKEALSDWAFSKQICGRCNNCQKRKVSYIISQLRTSKWKPSYDKILTKYGATGGR